MSEIAPGSSQFSAACSLVATTSAVFTRASLSPLADLAPSAASCTTGNGGVAWVFPGLGAADAIAIPTPVVADANAIAINDRKDTRRCTFLTRVNLPLLRPWLGSVTPLRIRATFP